MGCCASVPEKTPTVHSPHSKDQNSISSILEAFSNDWLFDPCKASSDDQDAFQKFSHNFDMAQQSYAIDSLLKGHPQLFTLHKSIVPLHLSNDEFWRRVFFKRHTLSLDHIDGITTSSLCSPLSKTPSASSNATVTTTLIQPVSISDELITLFDRYKAAGTEQGGFATLDSLQAGSFMLLADDFGVPLEDLIMLIIPYKLNASSSFAISRQEWIQGWKKLGATTLERMREMLPAIRYGVLNSKVEFKLFYNFVFRFVKDNSQRSLDYQSAIDMWMLLLKNRFDHLKQWCYFVETYYKKSINFDQWNQVHDFAMTVKDFAEFDPVDGAWPVIIDEFVDFMRSSKSNCCT